MASVTAKVKLESAEPNGSEQTTLRFGVDYADDRNKEWAAATPALSLTMTVRNEVAENHFAVNDRFTLTFDKE